MLADCLSKPLLKPAFLRQCVAMGMIKIGIEIGLGNGRENGFGIRIGIGNAVGTQIG
jgi:hypothetical protein